MSYSGDDDEDIGLGSVFEPELGSDFFGPGVFGVHEDDDDMWQDQLDFLGTHNPADQAVFNTPAGEAVLKVPAPAGQAVFKVPAPVFKTRKTREISQEGLKRFNINKKMTAIKNVVLALKSYKTYTNTELKAKINPLMRYWSEL
jgi:hypothetical protein